MSAPNVRYVVSVGGVTNTRCNLDWYAPVGVPVAEVILHFENEGCIDVRFERVEWDSWAWPGGYPIYYLCADGGVLCPKCANDNIDLTTQTDDKQWHIVGVDIHYEGSAIVCDHCNKDIESAYGDPDEGFDGDADAQALASAGHGTDEDYGSAEDVL